MKAYEDFDFFCPLTATAALERIREGAHHAKIGLFSGEVNGNHFNVKFDDGGNNDPYDDPVVTGYVLREGTGCRVFARAQVPPRQEYDAKFGMGAVIFMALMILYIIWDDNCPECPPDPLIWLRLPQILLSAATLIGPPLIGWRYMNWFKKSGRYEVISKFTDYMGAGMETNAAPSITTLT